MLKKSQISEICKNIRIEDYLSYRDYLSEVFSKIQADYPSYTYKDFAEQLGYARENNTIRLAIKGRRAISNKSCDAISEGLGLGAKAKKYFHLLVHFSNEKVPNKRDSYLKDLGEAKKKAVRQTLSEDQIEYFSSWYNPIIRELLAISSSATTPEAIQESLNFPLRLGEIKKSLELLERIGAIRYDKREKRYRPSRQNMVTDQEIDSLSIIRYHQKMIEMGKESLMSVAPEKRSINSITACIPKEAIQDIKKKIDKLLDEALAMEADLPSSEVFQLNIQFFPFTSQSKKDEP